MCLPMLCSWHLTNRQEVPIKIATIVSAPNLAQPIGVKRHLKVDMDLQKQATKKKFKNKKQQKINNF